MKEMQPANLSGPLKGLRSHHARLGLTQASGFAGGFDLGAYVRGNLGVLS